MVTLLSFYENCENLRHFPRMGMPIYLPMASDRGGRSVLRDSNFNSRLLDCSGKDIIGKVISKKLSHPFAMNWPASKPDGLFGSITRWVQGTGHNQLSYVFSSKPFLKQRINLYFYEEWSLHPHSRNKSSRNIIPSLTLRYILTTHGFGI